MTTETNRLTAWAGRLTSELDIADVELPRESIHILLDLARDAAHEIVRPAAPVTAFLVGVAVGRGESLGSAAATATTLALGWDEDAAADDD